MTALAAPISVFTRAQAWWTIAKEDDIINKVSFKIMSISLRFADIL